MLYGCTLRPCVSKKIFKDVKYGRLVPVGDARAMADAIIDQVRNPRPAAPAEAWRPYALENVVAAYERALDL